MLTSHHLGIVCKEISLKTNGADQHMHTLYRQTDRQIDRWISLKTTISCYLIMTSSINYCCQIKDCHILQCITHLASWNVVGLPRTLSSNDANWVIVDRLTKTVHFIPMKTTASLTSLLELYIKEVVIKKYALNHSCSDISHYFL